MILPNSELLPSGGANPASAASPAPGELTALVARAQGGDLPAQSELVRRYLRRIAGHVKAIIHQPDAVDDVAQMVFIKMVRRIDRLRDPALFECWLFTLSRHTAYDFIRRRRRRPATVAMDDGLREIPDSGDASAVGEIMDELDSALAHLSPVDRRLMTSYVEGHGYRDLAAQEGLTPSAVKTRLHRMRPFLRESLGAHESRRAQAREIPARAA